MNRLQRAALLAVLVAVPGLSWAANRLLDVEVASVPGRGVVVTFTADRPISKPASFSTDNPSRIALDFDGMQNFLQQRSREVAVGSVRGLTSLEAGGRTRVVVNLTRRSLYDMEVEGNKLMVIIKDGVAAPPAVEPAPVVAKAAPRPADANVSASAAVTPAVAPATPKPTPVPAVAVKPTPAPVPATAYTPAPAAAPAPVPAARPQAVPVPVITPGSVSAQPAPAKKPPGFKVAGPAVEDIDFRRGEQGEGRMLITLTDPSTVIDMRDNGGKIVMDLLNCRLPERLIRNFDVTDFGTPVKAFRVTTEGKNAHIEITASGEFEHLAYQTNNAYTIEFRPLTPEEKEEQAKKRKGFVGERLSLNFQDIEVRSVLQLLGDFTQLNMVVSDTVTGNITLRLQNVPWDQALDIILKSKGLAMRQTDNVIMVAPAAELAIQETNQLESERKIERLAPLITEYIQINYAKATEIQGLLQSATQALARKEGDSMTTKDDNVKVLNVVADPRTNTLLIRDTEANLAVIRKFIAKIDVPARQVMIESRVVIASDDFSRSLGVRFGFAGDYNRNNTDFVVGGTAPGTIPTDGLDIGNTMPGSENLDLMVNLPGPAGTAGINMLLGKVGSYLVQLEISAMEAEGRGETVSNPRVIAAEGSAAKITQGVQIPYKKTDDAGNTTTEFKDAALSLTVTPQITPDDNVILDLDISKDTPGATTEDGQAIDTRTVKTKVLVNNGETVVLGGVFEKTSTETLEKVPFFGDIPILGHAFRRNTGGTTNSELLVFVTPKILKQALDRR